MCLQLKTNLSHFETEHFFLQTKQTNNPSERRKFMLFNQKLFLDQFFILKVCKKKVCFHFDNIAKFETNKQRKRPRRKENAWIRPILFISTDFSNDLEYGSHSRCMCIKLNEPAIFHPDVNESFRCIAIAHTSKKPQIIKIQAIEWEQWQRNTKCWGISPLTQSSCLRWKFKHTRGLTHTHMWRQNWEEATERESNSEIHRKKWVKSVGISIFGRVFRRKVSFWFLFSTVHRSCFQA